MKLLIISPVLYVFWQAPTYSLLAIIGLLFIAQVISELMRSEGFYTEDNNSYQEIKELFAKIDEFDYPEETCTKLEVVPVNWKNYTYKDLQFLCKKFGIRANSKRCVLEKELLSVCT